MPPCERNVIAFPEASVLRVHQGVFSDGGGCRDRDVRWLAPDRCVHAPWGPTQTGCAAAAPPAIIKDATGIRLLDIKGRGASFDATEAISLTTSGLAACGSRTNQGTCPRAMRGRGSASHR